MNRSWLALPVLALLALLASAYWWRAERAAWHPPPPIQPELPQVAALRAPAPAQLRQALERPVFWESRRPVQPPAAGSAGGDAQLSQARLMAVLESGPRQVALLQRPDGSTLKIGVDGDKAWRLASFDGRVAVFEATGGRRIERTLEPAARAAPSGARAAASGRPASADEREKLLKSIAGTGANLPASAGSRTAPASRALPPPAAGGTTPKQRLQ